MPSKPHSQNRFGLLVPSIRPQPHRPGANALLMTALSYGRHAPDEPRLTLCRLPGLAVADPARHPDGDPRQPAVDEARPSLLAPRQERTPARSSWFWQVQIAAHARRGELYETPPHLPGQRSAERIDLDEPQSVHGHKCGAQDLVAGRRALVRKVKAVCASKGKRGSVLGGADEVDDNPDHAVCAAKGDCSIVILRDGAGRRRARGVGVRQCC
jgi:hypothetical protein